jgi:hypothetical protein
MSETRRPTTLYAFTACYRESFIFFFSYPVGHVSNLSAIFLLFFIPSYLPLALTPDELKPNQAIRAQKAHVHRPSNKGRF